MFVVFKIKRIYFIFVVCICTILSAETDYVNDTHKVVDNFIYDTSDYLDKFASGEDYIVEDNSLVSGELSYLNILEKSTPSTTDLNLKIRLLFPRFRKNYDLILENYRKSDSIDDTKQENRYLLGLAKGKARIGIKFRGLKPDLFVSYKLSYKQSFTNNWKFYMGNKAFYFTDYKFDNIFVIEMIKLIDNMTQFVFKNQYRFQEEYDDKHEVIHSFSLSTYLNNKSTLNYILSSYGTKDNTKAYGVDYFYTGVSYKEFYHKNWAYYQVDTGVTFRDENDFNARARIMIKLGVLFGNSKKLFF